MSLLYLHHATVPLPPYPMVVEGVVTQQTMHPQARMHHVTTVALTTIDATRLQVPLLLQIYHHYPLSLYPGDTVAFNQLTLKKATSADFATYLRKEGIVATLFATDVAHTIIKHPSCSFVRWISRIKEHLLQTFKATLSTPTFALFASLFLGEKATSVYELKKVQTSFKQWGILHYLARSGLHLVMVISVYEFLFRLLPLPFVAKHILLLFINCIYCLLSWPSISFIRAFLIFLFYKVWALCSIPLHFLHVLYLTCALILLYNPFQLFFLDFQLSFGFTFALGWLNQYKVHQKQ